MFKNGWAEEAKKSWQKTAATATAPPPPPTKWVWEQAIRPYHPISQIKTQSAANFNEKKRKKIAQRISSSASKMSRKIKSNVWKFQLNFLFATFAKHTFCSWFYLSAKRMCSSIIFCLLHWHVIFGCRF